jgi:hypothetical protein
MGRGGSRGGMGGGVGVAGRQAGLKGRSRRQQDMYAAQQGYSKPNGRGGASSIDDEGRPSSARHPNSRRPPAAALALGGRGGGRPQRAAGRFGRIDQDEAAEALLGMGFAYEVRRG